MDYRYQLIGRLRDDDLSIFELARVIYIRLVSLYFW